MPKKAIAKIHGVSDVPCVRSGKTDHVIDVAIGNYVYPLHITELWKEVKNADGRPSGRATSDKPVDDLSTGKSGKD